MAKKLSELTLENNELKVENCKLGSDIQHLKGIVEDPTKAKLLQEIKTLLTLSEEKSPRNEFILHKV